MPPTNEVIPFYQLRATQALLRAGMRADSILEAVNAFKSEGDGFLQALKAIESVSQNILPPWVKAIEQSDFDFVGCNSNYTQEIQLTSKPSPLENFVPPSSSKQSFTACSAVESPSKVPPPAEDDYCKPTTLSERHPSSLSITSRQRKSSQYVARHCTGFNGKCTAKSKKVWKYQSPWESHFRAEHLNDFLDVLTCTYICFCSPQDRGSASELMEHIWNNHMFNSVNAKPTASET